MKCLSTAAVAAMLSIGVYASAWTPQLTPLPWQKHFASQSDIQPSATSAADDDAEASRAADGYMLRFCGDKPSDWVGLGLEGEATYRMFLYITEDVANSLAGNQLTRIYLSASLGSQGTVPGTAWVAESLDGEPVTKVDIDVRNSYDATTPYQIAKLDEPYTIKAGQEFFFGFTMKATAKDYPIAVDGENGGLFGGYAEITYQGETALFSITQDVGTNLFLYARTQGEKTELTNVFGVGGVSLGSFALPVQENAPGAEATGSIYIGNYGGNALTSMDYDYSINGASTKSNTVEINVPANTSQYVSFPIPGMEIGRNTIDINVTKVNGVECNRQSSASLFNLIKGTGVDRKFVVEEGTATWCQFCPRGIVGMEYMQENYPENFVGIAVHVSDNLAPATYEPFSEQHFASLPNCIVNRDPYYSADPNWQYLEMMYEDWEDQASPVALTLATKLDEANKTVEVTANTKFVIDESNANYKLAFVVLEDSVAGRQTNGYAGQVDAWSGDWGSYGSRVQWKYAHTARGIYDCFGIDNSVPTEIKAGTDYTFTYQVPIGNVKVLANAYIVGLVLDTATGTILNADIQRSLDSLSGIGSALADTAAPRVHTWGRNLVIDGNFSQAIVYNMAGRQIAKLQGSSVALAPGIYLVNIDGRTHKVTIK